MEIQINGNIIPITMFKEWNQNKGIIKIIMFLKWKKTRKLFFLCINNEKWEKIINHSTYKWTKYNILIYSWGVCVEWAFLYY